MRRIFFILIFVPIYLTLTSCSSDGTKAANETIECLEKALNSSNDYDVIQQKFSECQQKTVEKYKDKAAADPKFREDFDKTFNEKYKVIEEKVTNKFK